MKRNYIQIKYVKNLNWPYVIKKITQNKDQEGNKITFYDIGLDKKLIRKENNNGQIKENNFYTGKKWINIPSDWIEFIYGT